MHKVLLEIKEIINKSISEYLPDVQSGDLEENGNIYYMNGRNGTEFDWHFNEHISDFMVFYKADIRRPKRKRIFRMPQFLRKTESQNDASNLGALKLTLYNDGKIFIYIYGEKGTTLVKKIESSIDITEQELLNLAVILKKEADDKGIFDESIDKIDSDIEISAGDITEFVSDEN